MNQRIHRTILYWQIQGTIALGRLILRKVGGVLIGKPLINSLADAALPPGVRAALTAENRINEGLTALQISDMRFPALRALKTYTTPNGRRRVSVVTDSVSKGSLFGGVGTAIILAAQLSIRMNAALRIITRTEKAPPENVQHILSVYGIELEHEIQFVFAGVDDRLQEVEIQPGEMFITTSWWTTAATLPAVPHADIVYLLQEDERMFYPYGDDRLKCEQILGHKGIRFLINTKLLFDHLIATGLPNIATQADWFEPAFPPNLFYPRKTTLTGKRRFFFYARPNNLRNLFHLGLEVIDRAINQGVLDAEEWEIYLVGKDIPPVSFGNGVLPQRCEDLSWSEYAELAGTVDLALSLMYTPHPSYPPLDMAASGAVVVTNSFGNKQDLSGYSTNILCAEPCVDALVEAVRQGVILANSTERAVNFENNRMQKSWQVAFSCVTDTLAGK